MAVDMNYKIIVGKPMPLGTTKIAGGINFAVMVQGKEDKNCSVILYKKGTLEVVTEIAFSKEMKFGKVYAMCIQGISLNEFDYNYRIGNKVVTDPYAMIINGGKVFGENDKTKKTSAVYEDKFKWDGDAFPKTSFSDSIIYRLHVRGFTMNRYSRVRKKGTFAGIVEKIPYLKQLGITMVELMPAYEFNENSGTLPDKVNYWGYTDADYLMPKVAYSYKKDARSAVVEFKTMVKELHKNGIEVCMEFAFDDSITPNYMIDCFRHWVINYHIDGIHCNMDNDIRGAVSADPYLTDTKIISTGFDSDNFSNVKHLGESNCVFMNTARKFLKGDGAQVEDMAFRVRYNKPFAQSINYMASNDTFTMMDMVSYENKHNEDNGEYNKDGMEYNYTWNCGIEGETRKKDVLAIRKRQLKNAMCLLMLSQGTPMIYAGDGFGDSAKGKNNPYCQDNDISYVNWRAMDKNKEYFEFTKQLICFRKAHNILHGEMPMEMKDYHSLGMPDMSFHSERTWSLDGNVLNRHFGVMLYGKYSKLLGKKEEESLFIGFNMGWEDKFIGLPAPGRGKQWKFSFSSNEEVKEIQLNQNAMMARSLRVPPRSVVVLEGEDAPEEEKQAVEDKTLNMGKVSAKRKGPAKRKESVKRKGTGRLK